MAVTSGVGVYVNTCIYHVLSQQIDSSKTTRLFLMKQLQQPQLISNMYVYTMPPPDARNLSSGTTPALSADSASGLRGTGWRRHGAAATSPRGPPRS